ncbi:carbohydrate-binding domain-containing protein [Cellulomonas oligotrophica]|uniref:Carbohydrate-binding domain-containing protein n=1 Tax=Cellulomonas oligotrophica TaxID=931536 RepID=A0A7Y9JZH4_9CELL|nr:carbohydrate-binding domain-containing protein [Cellulomonas oligotrophica]NYD86779.1 hypothetical protein [Cellulomonas oligotrophica]GIG32435.1 hypothetical protein Col01nite_15940 [Cellulomonas oligotrophica]
MRRTTARLALPATLAALLLAGCTAASTASSSTDASSSSTTTTTVTAADADVTVEEALAANTSWQESETTWDEADEVAITLDGTTATSDSDAVTVDGGTVTITAAGTYRISGELTDGQVVVDTMDEGVVRIVLDGADITSSTTSPLQVTTADEVVVVLADGTANSLTDAVEYVYAEGVDEPNAALFSAADLTITGEGSLDVTGNAYDGIASKDDLVIASGTITVTAVDDGVRGKDALVVLGGTLTVDAGGDGLKSDNDEDDTRGYVHVADGTVDVTAGDDGVTATTDVIVGGGALSVVAGGGASQAATVTEEVSPKGVAAGVLVLVGGGQVLVDAADDALHSDGALTVADGDVQVAAGDDGVHAEVALTIAGGTVDVAQAVEGLEAQVITVSGGTTSVVASDDGVNGSAASTSEETDATADGGMGAGEMGAVEGVEVVISDGTLVVDAEGDGLDSNGTMTISGGTVVVNGPTNSGNGSLDVNGTFEVTGGTVLAAGSSGMAQTPSADSSQSFVSFTFAQAQGAGEVLQVLDADGNVVATFETSKSVGNVVYSSDAITSGSEYQLAVGGTASGEDVGGLYASGDATGASVAVTGTAGVESTGMGGGMGGGGRRP